MKVKKGKGEKKTVWMKKDFSMPYSGTPIPPNGTIKGQHPKKAQDAHDENQRVWRKAVESLCHSMLYVLSERCRGVNRSAFCAPRQVYMHQTVGVCKRFIAATPRSLFQVFLGDLMTGNPGRAMRSSPPHSKFVCLHPKRHCSAYCLLPPPSKTQGHSVLRRSDS